MTYAMLISPVTAVRDLGVYIDSDVTMRTHVTMGLHDVNHEDPLVAKLATVSKQWLQLKIFTTLLHVFLLVDSTVLGPRSAQ